jgi:hypothetical protein
MCYHGVNRGYGELLACYTQSSLAIAVPAGKAQRAAHHSNLLPTAGRVYPADMATPGRY